MGTKKDDVAAGQVISLFCLAVVRKPQTHFVRLMSTRDCLRTAIIVRD